MRALALLSPTWALADYLKQKYDKTATIKTLNSLYLWISITSTTIIAIAQHIDKSLTDKGIFQNLPICTVLIWIYFLMSRNNEVFYAFLRDAFDKMEEGPAKKPPSKLTPKERITLSLKSYLELLLNFSLIYALVDKNFWEYKHTPSIIDFIYYSGVTITTTGYGDITPKHYTTQLLAVYEVFCGIILLVVCFAIYAGRLNNKREVD